MRNHHAIVLQRNTGIQGYPQQSLAVGPHYIHYCIGHYGACGHTHCHRGNESQHLHQFQQHGCQWLPVDQWCAQEKEAQEWGGEQHMGRGKKHHLGRQLPIHNHKSLQQLPQYTGRRYLLHLIADLMQVNKAYWGLAFQIFVLHHQVWEQGFQIKMVWFLSWPWMELLHQLQGWNQ